ncbi:MAG: TlyA family RNA methyltransferase, partial [Halanaerobium sp.]|nr:TlyA family RNA methyltransferase [Halanaerobium sp.]
MAKKRERLDKLLVDKGLFSSRSKAKGAIMAGEIRVDGEMIDKAGTQVPITAVLSYTGDKCPYVSRGGFKLEKALNAFPVAVKDKLVIDIGASTGGFTDCLLQNGAREVYAVDVGYGQLAWKLRQDPRVKVKERLNFRHATREVFPVAFEMATIDVSFISLRKILEPLLE